MSRCDTRDPAALSDRDAATPTPARHCPRLRRSAITLLALPVLCAVAVAGCTAGGYAVGRVLDERAMREDVPARQIPAGTTVDLELQDGSHLSGRVVALLDQPEACVLVQRSPRGTLLGAPVVTDTVTVELATVREASRVRSVFRIAFAAVGLAADILVVQLLAGMSAFSD